MDVVLLIGRVLFAALFLGSAFGHLTQTDAMAGYAASRGVAMARPATLVTGVLILLGGLSVLLGVWGDLGALLLVVFLLPTAFLMHGFWRETDPAPSRRRWCTSTRTSRSRARRWRSSGYSAGIRA